MNARDRDRYTTTHEMNDTCPNCGDEDSVYSKASAATTVHCGSCGKRWSSVGFDIAKEESGH